jgi:kynurenine formamidase
MHPTSTEVLLWFESLSNWGRWGDDDELGTLNLVTPEVRQRAARLVDEGVRVSCCWELEAAVQGGSNVTGGPTVRRFMIMTGEGLADQHRVHLEHPGIPGPAGHFHSAAEYVLMFVHSGTHVDALAHAFWDGRMYNGKPAALVNSWSGATSHAVTRAQDGIFTRGVLVDVPALRGVDWLEPGEGVYPDDLEAAEKRLGSRVRPGDALLVRTGHDRMIRERSPGVSEDGGLTQAGLHAACLPWLRERDVAVVACDSALDVVPSGYGELILPLHSIGIVAMGLWTIDLCDLERLAKTCRELERWEFLFTCDPLPISGATGSPVNPIATF